jgi:hypothetical protein
MPVFLVSFFEGMTESLKGFDKCGHFHLMQQHTLKNANSFCKTKITSYLGGKNFNLLVNVVHFLNISVY